MNWKSLLLLIIVAAAAVWGVLELNKKPDAAVDTPAEQVLLPAFEKTANTIDTIKVSKAGGEIVAELKRNDQQWVVSSKHDYPADIDKIRALLIDLIDARIVEEKTANPEYYERLGVNDVTQEDAEGVQVELKSGEEENSSENSSALIIGKLASNSGNGTYVRRSGENQSYLIGSTIALSKDSHQWLQQPIMEIPFDRVQRVSIHHPDGEILTLVKKNRDQKNLGVFNMLAGRELSYETVTNPTGSALANLRLEDVVTAADFNSAEQEAVKTEYYTFDGLVITLNLSKQDDKYYASIATRFDQEQADQFAEKTASDESQTDSDSADSKSDTDTADSAQESDDKTELVKQESETLNQRTSAWIYAISQYKYESMTKRLEDLLKPAEDNATEQSQNSNDLPSLGMPALDSLSDAPPPPSSQSTVSETNIETDTDQEMNSADSNPTEDTTSSSQQ